MKRTHIFTAVLLTAALAAPAALAQNQNGGGNGGQSSGMSTNASSMGNNGYGNSGGNAGNAVHGYRTQPGSAVMSVSPPDVRLVQQALNRLGYRAGPVDGRWNHETADAIMNFQQAHGIAPTGRLNHSTVAALGLSAEFRYAGGNGSGQNNGSGGNGGAQNASNNGPNIGGAPMPSQRIRYGSQNIYNSGFSTKPNGGNGGNGGNGSNGGNGGNGGGGR